MKTDKGMGKGKSYYFHAADLYLYLYSSINWSLETSLVLYGSVPRIFSTIHHQSGAWSPSCLCQHWPWSSVVLHVLEGHLHHIQSLRHHPWLLMSHRYFHSIKSLSLFHYKLSIGETFQKNCGLVIDMPVWFMYLQFLMRINQHEVNIHRG